MIFLKKYSLLLALALIVSLGFTLQAQAEEENVVTFDSENAFEDPITGELIQPFKLVDGNVELMSQEEYLAELPTIDLESNYTGREIPEIPNKSIVKPLDAYREYWTFKRSGTRTTISGSRIKASPDINCTTPTCGAAISVGATVSHSFSTSVNAEKDAIKAGAGYTWSTSATNSSTFSYNIKKGDGGYIGFTPYLWKVSGTLELRSNWDGLIRSKSAWGSYPKKLSNGQADGVYAFVYTKRG